MAYEPVVGDIIRYDFLWAEEQERGQQDGAKDRPCAIVVAKKRKEDGSFRVLLAPITHTPPAIYDENNGIEVPVKVARYLGLDDERSWIKTHQLNELTWPKDQIPVGVIPTKSGSWTYGSLPDALSKRLISEIRQRAQTRTVEKIDRSPTHKRKRSR